MSGITIVNGVAVPKQSDPFRSLFTGGRGSLKTTAALAEALMWISESTGEFVNSSVTTILKPISKSSSLASTICCFPDAIKFSIDAVKKAKAMAVEVSWSKFNQFSHTMIIVAERISEFVYGLMRLEIVGDALQMIFFKGLKSTFQIGHNVYVIREVNESDSKLNNIESDRVRDLKRLENNFKVIRSIINLCYHSLVIVAIVVGSVITGKMILAVGIASLASGIASHYVACERGNLENVLAAEKMNKIIEKAGGWGTV